MTIKSSKGSTLIEAALVGFLWVNLLIGASSLVYFSWAQVWLDHTLYEGLICLAEGQSQVTCQAQVEKRQKLALPWGMAASPRLEKGTNSYRGTVTWNWFKNYKIQIKQRLNKKDFLPRTLQTKEGTSFPF